MLSRTAFLALGHSHNGTVYLVLDCQANPQTVVADLLSGQYRRPLRVLAFNTEDSSIHDVSAEIARELLSCKDELELLSVVRDFRGAGGLVKARTSWPEIRCAWSPSTPRTAGSAMSVPKLRVRSQLCGGAGVRQRAGW
jgi:hypothetical protein